MAWAHDVTMRAVQSGKNRVQPYIGEFQREGYHHVALHAIPCARVSQDVQVAFHIHLPVKSHEAKQVTRRLKLRAIAAYVR